MAAPGVADARVPCPLCGGLIHPVAGRCKHCKQDLTAHRAGKPAAASPLPALIAAAAVSPQPARQVLPPRPTGTRIAAQPEPRSSIWRNWPVLVIVLAATAIIGAVVIMVWPQHRGEASHTLKPPPAPERMDTDPSPSTGADPWGKQGNAAPVVPRSTPDPLPAQPPQQPDDDQFGFGGLANGLANGGTVTGTSPDFMFAAMGHACKKLATCPNADDTLKSICDVYSSFPPAAPPANCAPAQRCLDAIDNMSCSQSGYGSPLSVVNMFQDCTKAITSC
ncbi:MAG: hypothetical protein JO257_29475 [Deltaproteobacteria bacterium]|nr:hypothetical protein [Deltaproteobacteria bacterium]